MLADPSNKGWLSLQETMPLLKAFKFTHMFLDEFDKPDDELTINKMK
jgi:hypothetical protein